MIHGKRVHVVLPAFNAARTLEATVAAIPPGVVDAVLVVDDASADDTVRVATALGLPVVVHPANRGYGANQKTCYAEALRRGADVVVMLHPDYQYDPRMVTAMASMVTSDVYDVVLGSRILGGRARAGGMPGWKYLANRLLTAGQNLALGSKLSEFHTGFRAWSRRALATIPLLANSDDFLFDNQVLAQAVATNLRIGEISVPTSYHDAASSIGFARSVVYGLGVVRTSAAYRAWKWGIARPRIFVPAPGDFLADQREPESRA